MFDWNDLRYLLAVAKAGSLTAAARELGVEHTTVGRRISALETALGTRLFVRGADGLTLTAPGREVLPLAEEMARQADAVERRVSGGDQRVEGTVRLTTSEAMSGYFVKQLGALRERHPALTIDILSGNRAFDLMRGEADVAVRIREMDTPDLVVRRLASLGWSLYAPPAYLERKGTPKEPEDLAGHDIIDFDATLATSPGAQWLRANGKGANVVLRGNSIVAVLNAAIVGLGIAPLPCFIGDAESTLQRVTSRCIGSTNVYMAVHPDLARVARVRAVMDFIVEAFERDRSIWSGTSVPLSA